MTAVLITRPEPDAAHFAQLCRDAGLEPIMSPLMEPVIGAAPVDLTDVAALAFTSANGVRAFAANSGRRDLPVFAVGSATAAAAKSVGFRQVSAADGDVDSLARLISRRPSTGVTLHIAGTRRSGDLIALLEKEKHPARRAVLYEMNEADALPAPAVKALTTPSQVLWVTLFSPRTTALFMRLIENAGLENSLGRANAACLSDAVAELLPSEKWARVFVAPEREANSMIELITAHLEGGPRPA
ncbi:MAG: uroporphyrinogen-III synthase [Pseudomonadota bacterium]